MKPSEVVEIIADIEDAWREFSPDKKRLYAKALSDLNAEACRRAVGNLIRRSRWLPTVAEIRDEERDERGVHPDVPLYGYVRYALEPGPEEIAEMTPEQRERWEAVKTLLHEKPVGRAYPKALDDIPDEALRPRHILRPGDFGSCSGQPVVEIAGMLCCSHCDYPMETELVRFGRSHYRWPEAERTLCGRKIPPDFHRPRGELRASCSRCSDRESIRLLRIVELDDRARSNSKESTG